MKLNVDSPRALAIIVSSWCCFFVGCSQESAVVFAEGLKVDTLRIEVPEFTSANLVQSSSWHSSGEDYLVGYNYLDHSLSILNISSRFYDRRIKLRFEGPNFVEEPKAVSYIGSKHFLLVSDNYISILNYDGQVVNRYRINHISSIFEGMDFDKGRILFNRNSGLQFDQKNMTFMAEAYLFDSGIKTGWYIALIDLNDLKIKLISLPKFKSKREEESFGDLNRINYSRQGDTILVNPKFSSEIVLLVANNDSFHFNLNSNLTSNKSLPLTGDKNGFSSRQLHRSKSVEFYGVASDLKSNYYLRVHSGPSVDLNEEKDFYMMFFDKSFEKYVEIPFPKGYYIKPLSAHSGLMFMAFNKYDEIVELIHYKWEGRSN